MKTKTRENERRDSIIIIILILLLGFICIIITSGWALRFTPSWKLDTNMGSNLNPNSDFLTNRPVSFFEPIDSAILTQPAWADIFLTPGASFSTRIPTTLPTIAAVTIPPKTSTPNATKTISPTPTLTSIFPTVIPSKISTGSVPTNTPIQTSTPTRTPTPTATATYTSTATSTSTSTATPTSTSTATSTSTSTPTATSTSTSTPTATPIPVDLQINKSDGVTTYTAGNTLTYTLVVTNNGAFAVNGATVTDLFPAQIISATWVCSGLTGGTCTASGSGNINDLVNLPVGATVTYTVTATTSVNAVGALENTASVFIPIGYSETSPGNNQSKDIDTPASTEPDIGPPDGNDFVVIPGASKVIIFSPPIVANGDAAPDFVYYEVLASPTRVDLDWVMIEISPDGVTWYQVFFWGDGLPETNSNVDITVIGGTEADNRPFLPTDLYNTTGITIDVDTNVPPGSYPWMRISSPAGSTDGANIDSIEVLP